MSLPWLVIALPALYGCQQCLSDGPIGREFEHYGRLSLENVQLVLVGQKGLREFCIGERCDPRPPSPRPADLP